MNKIRVLICDDMIYICDFFELAINKSDTCVCCGKANNEKDAVTLTSKLKPDIILLDIQMDSQFSGLNIMGTLKDVSPDSKIIVVSVNDDKKSVFDAINGGASDYIFKNQPIDTIIRTIETVYGDTNQTMQYSTIKKLNEQYCEIEQRQKSLLFMFNKMLNLSKHELKILKAIYDGKSYSQIASENFVEEVTIRGHVHRIVHKMGFQNINTLIAALSELQIFTMFDDDKL